MKTIRWIARVWSVPLLLYALMMVIGNFWNLITIGTPDPYAVGNTTFVDALPPILLLLSVIGLGLAWRWELVGSLVSLAFLAAALITILIQHPLTSLTIERAIPYILVLAVLIPGILFLAAGGKDPDIQTV